MIYFDNAATTFPKPRRVEQAVDAAIKKFGANSGRGGHKMSMETSEQIYLCREKLAELFGAQEPENVIFTLNCTHALNFVIKGLAQQGDHFIISQLEHNAVLRPVHKLYEKGVITYDIASVTPGDESETVKNFQRLIKPETKAIVCTCVSNVFGTVLPIAKIGEMAKKQGVLFVADAAQAAGVLPIDVKKMNIDFLCFPGHKGLYGPMGTGALVVNSAQKLDTLIEGGTGSVSSNLEQPDFYPDRFESGTLNTAGIIGLSAGVDFVRENGISDICRHESGILDRIYDGLKNIDGVVMYTGRPDLPLYAPVLSFNVQGLGSEETAARLNDSGIAVRAGYHCAPLAHYSYSTQKTGTVRVAPSFFNTSAQADYFIAEVTKIAKSVRV